MAARRPVLRHWLAFICTHNPCYVISAVLVMYGLYLSFANKLDPADGWLLMKLLMGYTALLAGAAITIVRLGRVWDDARTIILLVLLILVALSGSFDRICLDDANVGALFLAIGFFFSLAVSELLIRGLGVRLPWSYRGPLYLQLALLFAYPAWLGRLSLTDREPLMAWFVLAYPALQAVTTLLLAPAVRRRGQDLTANGTPWSWPWYPLTLHTLLGASGLLRAVAISLSFSPAKGFVSGLAPYVFIPLILAWLLLVAEGTFAIATKARNWVITVVGLSLLALALPGSDLNRAQALYLQMLQDTVGAPVQIAAFMLILFFAYLWRRGMEPAEVGLLAAPAVLAVVDRNTVDVHSFAFVQSAPLAVLIGVLVVIGLKRGSAARIGAAILLTVLGAAIKFPESVFAAYHGYLLIHPAFIGVLLTGVFFRDRVAAAIAYAAPLALPVAALTAATAYQRLFPAMPWSWHALYVTSLGGTAALYWWKQKRPADLQAFLGCAAALALLCVERLTTGVYSKMALRGKVWIMWGGLFLFVGFAVSLIKAGQLRRLRRWLTRINREILP
jgi:hypothetical protein